jgi:hypothetical protein
MPRPRSKETERRWREIVERQARSGLSVRQFCDAEGVSTACLYLWRRRLRPGTPAPAAPAVLDERPAPTPRDQRLFVPLALLDATPALEILHPRGCRVRVIGEVGAVALRQVLEALDREDGR